MEQEQLQQEAELDVKINEEEVTTQTHSLNKQFLSSDPELKLVKLERTS